MKVNWNTKYNTICVYTFILVCSIILFYLSISQLGVLWGKIGKVISLLQPFIFGFAIAYLLDFLLRFYESKMKNIKCFEKANFRRKRTVGLILTYITTFLVIVLFMQFVLPQVIDSLVGLINDIPTYINNTTKLFQEIVHKFDLNEEVFNFINTNFNDVTNYIIKQVTNMLPVLGGLVTSTAAGLWNVVLGIIISIYILIDKEKFCALAKKISYAILPQRAADKTIEITHRSSDTFGKFLSGKILDSLIIGILTFVVLTIFKMPYTLLVSVIVGITNNSFFGPFVVSYPVIIILFVSPVKALWFLLIILVIQQIDGNIIGPKILGDSIGISAFWILFSILVAGKFLGLVGMVIGVPLFAVIYSIIKEVVESQLDKKGMKTKTEDYM
ncbi:MAG: AI-2E family transporter [Clostridium paraputrificum]